MVILIAWETSFKFLMNTLGALVLGRSLLCLLRSWNQLGSHFPEDIYKEMMKVIFSVAAMLIANRVIQ